MKPHTLISIGGSLTPDLVESWNCTLRVLGGEPGAATAPIPVSDLDTYLAEIKAPLASWFGATIQNIGSTVKLNFIKANDIGADGKYTQLITHVTDYSTPVPGGKASPAPLDIINSIVYSWRSTARTRGPASKGRMYPPNFGYSHSAGTGRISSGDRGTALTSATSLLSVFRNVAGTIHGAPVLISTTNDAFAYINRVMVDDIIDVQRRRKNQLVPSAISTSWP